MIWAVSFAEGTDTSINYAQTVWYNCLPAKNYSVDNTVKFWDAADADNDNQITVSYTAALAAKNAGKSITDPCLGWEKTERLIYDIAENC